jgi:hypothetical protein
MVFAASYVWGDFFRFETWLSLTSPNLCPGIEIFFFWTKQNEKRVSYIQATMMSNKCLAIAQLGRADEVKHPKPKEGPDLLTPAPEVAKTGLTAILLSWTYSWLRMSWWSWLL